MGDQREALSRAQACLAEAAWQTDQAARELSLVAAQADEVHPGFQWGDAKQEDISPKNSDLRLDLMAASRYAQEAGRVGDTLHRWAEGLQGMLDRVRGPEPKVEANKHA